MAGVPVEFLLLVADLADAVAGDLADPPHVVAEPVTIRQPDLTPDHHHARGGEGLAGDPGVGLFRQKRIQNGIRDAVAQLVRVPLRNRFGGEDVIRSCHELLR